MAPPGNILFISLKLSFNSICKKCSDRCVARCLFALIAVFILFIVLYLLQPFQTITHVLVINTKGPPLHSIPANFLSIALDSSLIALGLSKVNMTLLLTLMKPLGGSYLRIGGTMADRLHFEELDVSSIYKQKVEWAIDGGICSHENSFCDPMDRPNFTMSGTEWLDLNRLAKEASFTILFDLNVLIRNQSNGLWNSANAEELISFSNKNKLDLIWELGNEPNSFQHVFNYSLNPSQLKIDFMKLRQILRQYPRYSETLLVGPDVTRPLQTELFSKDSEKYLEQFLSGSDNIVDAITWHQYYFNGRDARLQYYVNPDVFDVLESEIFKIKEIVHSVGYGHVPIWLGETSDAYGGGSPGISEAFASTFIWLDKLGMSAKYGIDVVIRQSLYKGHYALIKDNYTPTPNWWLSVLFKAFVGAKVLPCHYAANREVRLYCHCARKEAVYGQMPAVTIYGMNMKQSEATIRIQDMDNLIGNDQMILTYILETHVSILSGLVFLNDIFLELSREGKLPPFKPRFVKGNVITLPAYSLGFWVIPNKHFDVCNT